MNINKLKKWWVIGWIIVDWTMYNIYSVFANFTRIMIGTCPTPEWNFSPLHDLLDVINEIHKDFKGD